MNLFERHYRALEKNKQANKAMKKRAYERYLEKAKGRNQRLNKSTL